MARSQRIIVKDGAIDTFEIAKEAKENVDRDQGVPIHACGLKSYGDCPCWTCTTNSCAACFASLY